MTFIVHPEAALEVDEAFSFYATRSQIIAADFLNQFEHATAKLLQQPQLYPVVRTPDIRKHVMQQFPYSVIYRNTVSGDTQILALAHHKRRPFYWASRA
jgi:toxin ParE1/3/4